MLINQFQVELFRAKVLCFGHWYPPNTQKSTKYTVGTQSIPVTLNHIEKYAVCCNGIISAKSVHNFKILAMTSVPDHCISQNKPPGHISCNSSALQVTPIMSSSLARGTQNQDPKKQCSSFLLPTLIIFLLLGMNLSNISILILISEGFKHCFLVFSFPSFFPPFLPSFLSWLFETGSSYVAFTSLIVTMQLRLTLNSQRSFLPPSLVCWSY